MWLRWIMCDKIVMHHGLTKGWVLWYERQHKYKYEQISLPCLRYTLCLERHNNFINTSTNKNYCVVYVIKRHCNFISRSTNINYCDIWVISFVLNYYHQGCEMNYAWKNRQTPWPPIVIEWLSYTWAWSTPWIMTKVYKYFQFKI